MEQTFFGMLFTVGFEKIDQQKITHNVVVDGLFERYDENNKFCMVWAGFKKTF